MQQRSLYRSYAEPSPPLSRTLKCIKNKKVKTGGGTTLTLVQKNVMIPRDGGGGERWDKEEEWC